MKKLLAFLAVAGLLMGGNALAQVECPNPDPDEICIIFDDFTLMTTFRGDINGDGNVGISDLGILAGSFGSTNAMHLTGDVDLDMDVDISDLGIMAGAFGQTSLSGAAGMGLIPEPGTSVLLLCAGLALLAFRSRSRA